jgi:hypothetical protein
MVLATGLFMLLWGDGAGILGSGVGFFAAIWFLAKQFKIHYKRAMNGPVQMDAPDLPGISEIQPQSHAHRWEE